MTESSISVQKKCSISALLSEPSLGLSEKEILQKLNHTRESLLHLLELLQTSVDFNIDNFNKEVKLALSKLEELKGLSKKKLMVYREDISEISAIGTDVILLSNERKRLQDHLENYKAAISRTRLDKDFTFNVVTPSMISKNGVFSSNQKRRRLESEKVEALDDWYTKHTEKPFLTENTLNMLEGMTGLTKVQIKNWISNKRRKDRSDVVSDELSALLD